MVIVQGQTDLPEIVPALRATGRFAHLLHGWQQQCHQDRKNRDHDQ
jgi:hypothetical protein